MKNVVTITDGELRLCSNLGEYAFGKTKYNSNVTETGILATCDSAKGEPLHFSFENWSFADIKSFDVPDNEERVVFFCNKNPLSDNAKTLIELFEKSGSQDASTADKDNMYYASLALCSILTQAAKEGLELPLNGGGGIIVDGFESSSKQKLQLLFLPHNVYKTSIGPLKDIEQADLYNCWINPSLQGLPAICFMRSCVAYKMLTGRYPYPSANTVSRNADMLDKNFLPLELSVNGINQELAQAVNKGLKLNSNSVDIPGKRTKGKKSEDLTPEKDFPLELLANAKENISSALSDEEFEEKANSYKKMQSSRIKTKRTIRRNTTTITVCIIAVICAIFIGRNTYRNYLDDYTTKGLTSVQTIQAFFKGMNTMDINLIQTFIEGRSANRYADAISNVYVISKQRMSYGGGDSGYVKPAKYFVMLTNSSMQSIVGLYGATNIKVDGKTIDEYIELRKNKDNPPSITQEQGVTINKGDKSVHSVTYYTLHTEGTDNDIYVTKCTDTFTLTFKKNKWMITDIESNSQDVELDSALFKSEYFNLLLQNNNDVIKTINQLSYKYDWLPSEKELKIEKQEYEEYLSDPFKGIL